MAKCTYCGEETRLFHGDTPVCLICSDLTPEQRARRKDQHSEWQDVAKADSDEQS